MWKGEMIKKKPERSLFSYQWKQVLHLLSQNVQL